MKKLLSITLTTLLVLFASQAFGQSSDDTNLNASAEIIATGLDIEELRSLDFGILTADESETIAFNSDDAGALDITGESETDIYINAPSDITLTGPSGSDDLTITDLTFGTNTSDIASGATSYTLNEAVSTSDDDPGKLFFYIGGELEIPSGQDSGDYTGTANIEVSYNSF